MMFKRSKKRQKIHSSLDQYEDYDPVIEELDNSFVFQLPEEADNLRRAWEHRQAGGDFVVRKSFRTKGIKNRVVAKLLHFPSADEVEEIVEERFGGGIYTIHPGNSPKILMTYELDGESKFLVDGPKPKTSKQILQEQVDEIMGQEFPNYMDENPEFAKRLLIAYVQKELGITLPTQEENEDKEFLEQLKRNPVLYQRWFEAQLKEKYGVVLNKKPTAVEEIEWALRIQAQFLELAGVNTQDDSWQAVLKELAMGFLDAAPYLIGLIPQLGAPTAGETRTLPDSESPAPHQVPEPSEVLGTPFIPSTSISDGTSPRYTAADREDERLA